MKKALLSLLGLAVFSTAAVAGPSKTFKQEIYIEPDTCVFRDFEFQIDGFYSGIIGTRNSRIGTGSGGGFGLNMIFARYFGIGYEAFWTASNNGVKFPLAGNFILRYPICALNLAPYALVGGGAAWPHSGPGFGYGNVGGGLEFRFTDNIGIFADGRYYYGGVGNLANIRSGLRFAF